MSEADLEMTKKPETPPKRRPKKIIIPKRTPSVVVPEKTPTFITADKITCVECPCFPQEDPYDSYKKLNPCQKSPLTLYELSAAVVDSLDYPDAFSWTVDDVAKWMEEEVGLPQYKDCILENHIDGKRLLMLEDPSKLAELNIKDFEHIKTITSHVRRTFFVEYVRFNRSVSLPPRKPLTYCTWFKSRTGPTYGIRENWTRCDILRWMRIISPEPVKLDHWDLVWYQPPDFPKVKYARIPKRVPGESIPRYIPAEPEPCGEVRVPRKFKILKNIPNKDQYIWMYKPPELQRIEFEEEQKKKKQKAKKRPLTVPKDTRLMPKKISLTGLTGKEFLLAKRKMAKPKFLPYKKIAKN